MKQLVIGVLAHVDAGKTTLSEALLYTAGAIPTLGRVDHRDAYLDTHDLERARGITIFSKQALFRTEGMAVTLLDTPGHVDFSTEMERTLQVLDYAILVISATDGVQAHTETLWRLLRRNHIPTFLFVTKMDLPDPGAGTPSRRPAEGAGRGLPGLHHPGPDLGRGRGPPGGGGAGALPGHGDPLPRDVSGLIRLGKVTPVFFGSALHLEGVETFLQGLETFTEAPAYGEAFAARVFKIARDHQGNRLTYLKVTGGALSVRAPLTYLPRQGEEGVEEKVTQLRLYSGAKFQTVDTVSRRPGVRRPGPHPDLPRPGPGGGRPRAPASAGAGGHLPPPPAGGGGPQGPPAQAPPAGGGGPPAPPGVGPGPPGDPRPASWARCRSRSSSASSRTASGWPWGSDQGRILYKETIAAPVEGVGHFEPLRHYAEVHLLLEPGARGRGLVLATRCSEDVLAGHWQRLILTHLAGAYPPGGPHRRPRHGPEDHPHVRPGPPEAHRGGRLPPGHLPGGAPGPHGGRERPAGALVRVYRSPSPPTSWAGPSVTCRPWGAPSPPRRATGNGPPSPAPPRCPR